MAERIKLTEQNQENIQRISMLLNSSVNALGNYLISKGSKILEENFKKMDKDLIDSFKKALKKKKALKSPIFKNSCLLNFVCK
jgi:hypothetical protein